jgi:uncharacterized protein YprB with RNaseH-like and TPR domain
VSATIDRRFGRLKAFERSRALVPLPDSQAEYSLGVRQSRDSWNTLERILGACPKTNQHGEHLSLHCWFGEPAQYTPDLTALRMLVRDVAAEVADPGRWLFLDTETTGLAGGSGTYAFLIGIAWWDDGGLQIEQLFMRDYSEERSLLFALRERLAERPVLVTFNGKTFDWPLLETRYRMSRKIPPPAPLVHLDFLHPARNLWRLKLGSVRLSELERHVLGRGRSADILSDLIPRIYFDFLRGGPPERLVPIFQHNQMDLRGLAALSAKVLSLLADPESLGQDGLELFGVSRICEMRGDRARARKLYEKSIASVLPAAIEQVAKSSLARLAKRDGDFAVACDLWKSAVGNSRRGYEAYEQLAIYYEHRVRDLCEAREIVRRALDELRRASRIGAVAASAYGEFKTRFEHRLARLERKSRRSLLDVLGEELQPRSVN